MDKVPNKRVVIVTNIEKASRRDCLAGIFRFAREQAPWSMRLLQADERTGQNLLASLDTHDVDGILTSESGVDEIKSLARSAKIPIVAIGTRDGSDFSSLRHVASVRIDDAEIGRFGAERLCSYGRFASCAFLKPAREPGWASLRERHFRSEFAARIRCPFFSHTDDESIDAWLARLPKPAAIMAANDTLAFAVLEAASAARIPVPQSVAVIGTDNDVFLCDMAKPPLSSILPDHEEVGFAAATELQRLMSGGSRAKPKTVLCKSHRFVERESSRPVVPAAIIIRRAITFIKANAKNGIRPEDVAAHIGVSRRLLDLRFHEFSGKTVMETVRDCQLDAAKEMLEGSSLPIRMITERIGFRNEAYPKVLFRRRFGMSMRQWRALHAADTVRRAASGRKNQRKRPRQKARKRPQR